ncbi:MAG: hypothetical protein A2Y79_14765 [Deltaproteobacteria bacterium RBG_13_43_22]|nr:MAG: hypothetical protein A2Y79_14765 [Deltaproteobacteria bacterium RBG_13_43_22]
MKKNIALFIFSFLLFSLINLPAGAADEFAYSQKITRLIKGLQADGFIVQEGDYRMIDILKLCSDGWLKYCFGNNAGFPYLAYLLPPAPGQKPSRGQKPPVGFNPGDPKNFPANIDFMPPGITYKLRPDEAILFIGKTPPPAKYFSYRSYVGFVANKFGKDYSDVYTLDTGEGGVYHRVFASLGDPINHLNQFTSGTRKGESGNPFNKETVVVTSAHKGVYQRVRKALKEAGIPFSIVNEDIIPLSMVNMGLQKGKDTFLVLTRAALWEDESAGRAFLEAPKKTCRVFRLTPQKILNEDPYAVPKLKPRGNGVSEFKIIPKAAADLETLRRAILEKYGSPDYQIKELHTTIWLPDGFVGIADDLDVLAEDRDTTYLKTDDFQLKSDDDFVIVYGVNHEKTGKAVYCNVSFYGQELLNGVAGSNSSKFTGSARKYFPRNHPGADFYYQVKFARKKSTPDDESIVVETSTGNPKGKAYGVDHNKDAFIAFRSYIEKPNQVGPAHFELIYDRAILFTKK